MTTARQVAMKSSLSKEAVDDQVFLLNDMVLDLFDPAIDEALHGNDHDLFDDGALVESMTSPTKVTCDPIEVSEEEESTTESLAVVSRELWKHTHQNLSTVSSTVSLTSTSSDSGSSSSHCTKTASTTTASVPCKPLPQDLPPRPKRSLSAYNLFFQAQRKELLDALPSTQGKKPRKSHGKMGFALMARTISGRWKEISREDKKYFEGLAAVDMARYEREMAIWKEQVRDYPELAKKTYKKKPKDAKKVAKKSSGSCRVDRKRTTCASRSKSKKVAQSN
eukprot:CAMPEP_0168739038 /NCGR_PEP_ID=MMETSP0724-20121128/11246_1 /TAXON_ID=265536 /ORGANISM="Amphiprora sp., Strain CCMP467" /LENGTH=278 /DNA_ID=CAMNT_0008786407 /DNA_START=59 /DNA_END=895 /DNA_ORIENTATION=+